MRLMTFSGWNSDVQVKVICQSWLATDGLIKDTNIPQSYSVDEDTLLVDSFFFDCDFDIPLVG